MLRATEESMLRSFARDLSEGLENVPVLLETSESEEAVPRFKVLLTSLTLKESRYFTHGGCLNAGCLFLWKASLSSVFLLPVNPVSGVCCAVLVTATRWQHRSTQTV